MSAGEVIFFAMLLAPFLVGFALGRWWFLAVPVAVWIGIAIFLRENNGWHGAGWGEFGIALNVLWAILTCVSASVGIGLRRLQDHVRAHPAP